MEWCSDNKPDNKPNNKPYENRRRAITPSRPSNQQSGQRESYQWIIADVMQMLINPVWIVRVAAADAFMRLVRSPKMAEEMLNRAFSSDPERLIAADSIWEAWSCSPRAALAATALLLRMDRPNSEAIELARKIRKRMNERMNERLDRE